MCTALEKLNPELAHELTTMVRLSADHYLSINKVQYDNQNLNDSYRNERALGDALKNRGSVYTTLLGEYVEGN